MSQAPPPDFTELRQFSLDPAVVRRLPRKVCEQLKVVVLEDEPRKPIKLGMLYPDNGSARLQAAQILNRLVEPVRLNKYEIERALKIGFEGLGGEPDVETVLIPQVAPNSETKPEQLVDHTLSQAITKRASDIHFETYPDDCDIRFRIDGLLRQQFTHVHPINSKQVINRIKVLASLDISEHRRPQDGRFRISFSEDDQHKVIDFRVSIVPGPDGEDAVLRVLDPQQGLLSVDELGMPPSTRETFLRLLNNPEGMVLVTGPTGCGKTTTMYSALREVSDETRKVITVEDPIEYKLDKINQKQVGPVTSMSQLLRAILRHDPDVILVGEIRDEETGTTALQAASTGHLVLSTTHTSDSVGAIERLRSLGFPDYDIASALLAVVSQRLVRKVCPYCVQPTIPTQSQAELFGDVLDGLQFVEGAGCAQCNKTGYHGRIGIYEVLIVDEKMQDLITAGARRTQLRKMLRRNGHRSLVEEALLRVHTGITTLDEIVRILPYRQLVTDLEEFRRQRERIARERAAQQVVQKTEENEAVPSAPS